MVRRRAWDVKASCVGSMHDLHCNSRGGFMDERTGTSSTFKILSNPDLDLRLRVKYSKGMYIASFDCIDYTNTVLC
jgi:hypothetical protein